MKRRSNRRRQAGFTLIELMISLVMFSLAVAGVLSVAVTLVQGYRETRNVIQAENAVRVPVDFMADALRQVSPGVPTGKIQDSLGAAAGNCPIGALTVLNNTGPNNADTLDIIYASGAVVTSLRDPYVDASTATVEVNDAFQLAAGDSIIVTDMAVGHLLKITSIAGNVLTLTAPTCTLDALPGGGYGPGSLVIRAQHAVFSIGAIDGVPTLMFDPDAGGPAGAEPLAEGVEDLQVAVGIDRGTTAGVLDENGAAAEDDDWVFNKSGEALPSTVADEFQCCDSLTGVPSATGTPRAARITIISRSRPQPGVATPYALPAVEDRAVGAADAFRRRVLHSTIEFRNFGGSP